jgi:hypothetical protein
MQAQSFVSQAESCCLKQDWENAIQFYTQAADLFSKAAKLTDDPKVSYNFGLGRCF